MPSPARFLLPLAALLFTSLHPAEAQPVQAGVSKAEASMLESLMLDDFARVEYRDADDNAISFEQFMEAVKQSKSFSMEKEMDHSLAVVRISDGKPAATESQSIATGAALPSIGALHTLDGKRLTGADLQGRYSLLSFHFAECAPCIAEIPALNAFAAAHPEIGAWAVTFDDTATSQAFVEQRGLELPVIVDAQAFIDAVGVTGYPTWLLVDASGRIAAVHTGGSTGDHAASEADIAAWVDAAIE